MKRHGMLILIKYIVGVACIEYWSGCRIGLQQRRVRALPRPAADMRRLLSSSPFCYLPRDLLLLIIFHCPHPVFVLHQRVKIIMLTAKWFTDERHVIYNIVREKLFTFCRGDLIFSRNGADSRLGTFLSSSLTISPLLKCKRPINEPSTRCFKISSFAFLFVLCKLARANLKPVYA